jgi:hypothetical protein
MRVSNNFQDRTKQTITLAAHKEFVEWVDKEGNYPELWVWHAAGSKFGQTDWLDVCEGVLCASGLIDQGKEDFARAIVKECDGVSHGFLYVAAGKDITKYRDWEISVLPKQYAANNYFDSGIRLVGEDLMPFNAAKKALLEQHFGADQVAVMERETEGMVEALKGMGVEYKEFDETVSAIGEVHATNKAIGDLVAKLGEKFGAIDTRLEAMQKSIDEGIEQAMTPRVEGATKGFEASKAASTEVNDGDPIAATAKSAPGAQANWFNETVMGAIARGF